MNSIKPIITTETAMELASDLYGFSKIHVAKELISFCDRNFYIKGSRRHQDEGDEFVLKILNSMDSQEEEQLDAELKASQFLRKRGFPCPQVYNIEGTSEKIALVQLSGSHCEMTSSPKKPHTLKNASAVRLISFLSGDIVDSLDRNPDLMFIVGKFVGALSQELKDFSHPGLKSRSEQNFRWDVLEFFNLEKYIRCLSDEDQIHLFRDVHQAFVAVVKPKLKYFRRGAVHNDLNGENILVSKPPYIVTGVFDFGDMVESVIISEISNAMAFFMEGDRGVEFGGYILAGYQSIFPLPEQERDLLYYFVAVRLCQLALYSQCNLIEQPYDKSWQACLKKYMSILRSFWGCSKEKVEKIWQNVVANSDTSS